MYRFGPLLAFTFLTHMPFAGLWSILIVRWIWPSKHITNMFVVSIVSFQSLINYRYLCCEVSNLAAMACIANLEQTGWSTSNPSKTKQYETSNFAWAKPRRFPMPLPKMCHVHLFCLKHLQGTRVRDLTKQAAAARQWASLFIFHNFMRATSCMTQHTMVDQYSDINYMSYRYAILYF